VKVALPSDAPSLVALVLGATLVLYAPARRLLVVGSLGRFKLAASLIAALLSAAYVAYYLRGGPRIVDATTYWLQARALGEGHLAWQVSDPPSAEAGRFLVRDTLGGGDRLAGIFPPGWPAVLSLGFLVGAPLAVGPVLAFAVTWLTVSLASAAADAAGLDDPGRAIPRVAGALSVVCAALRYHTADTMSHGLAAVCFTAALVAAFELRRADASARWAWALGLSLGWLFATRPISALPAALACALALGRVPRPGEIAQAVAAALPGVALFFLHQRAATGAWLASSQTLYYASSDGPPGCFRYGLGPGIGCLHEHGDFVEKYLPDGYGPLAALGTTLRRLARHAVDATNAEPLAIATAGALFSARGRATRALLVAPVALVLAYAPFYFDGNYPGGGARFFADALPIEHVALALAVPRFAGWIGARRARSFETVRGAAVLVGFALLGFAFRAHVDHESLRDREGGRPMFEARALRDAGVTSGLLFIDTDHGFSLAFDPDARADRGGLEVARWHGDATDRLLFEARGRPPAFTYDYDLESGRATVVSFVPPEVSRIEGETLWPALEQRAAAALPGYGATGCGSGQRTLRLYAYGGPATVRLALPSALAGRRVRVRVGDVPSGGARVELGATTERSALGVVPEGACVRSEWVRVPSGPASPSLTLTWGASGAADAPLSLDAVELGGPEESR
jgi:hypothetical protein